jgi:hypothetical protein
MHLGLVTQVLEAWALNHIAFKIRFLFLRLKLPAVSMWTLRFLHVDSESGCFALVKVLHVLFPVWSQQVHHRVQLDVLWRWLICFAKWMGLVKIWSRFRVIGDLVSALPVQELLSRSLYLCTFPPHQQFILLILVLITCFLPWHCDIRVWFQHIIILVGKGVLSFSWCIRRRVMAFTKVVDYLVFHYLDALVTCIVVHWKFSRQPQFGVLILSIGRVLCWMDLASLLWSINLGFWVLIGFL